MSTRRTPAAHPARAATVAAAPPPPPQPRPLCPPRRLPLWRHTLHPRRAGHHQWRHRLSGAAAVGCAAVVEGGAPQLRRPLCARGALWKLRKGRGS
eukprot:263273-Chlamydomonas_euryale.AAC.1